VRTLIASPERPSRRRPAGVPQPRETLPADGVRSRSSPAALDARVPPVCNGGLGRFGHDFGRMPVFPLVRLHLQGNGLRSPSGDRAEREADAAADQVIRMPDSAAAPGRKPELHAGADETPPTIDEVVANLVAVADDLVDNPTATVRIECGDPDPKTAERRAWDLVEAILKVGHGRGGWDLRSARNFNVVAFGLIDLGDANAHARRPTVIVDRPDLEIDAARRGRVVEKWLAGRGRRRAAK
jgi:hypothetical protein